MFLMVLLSMIGFCLLRKHILLTLLSLEGCNLGICMIVSFLFLFFRVLFVFVMYYFCCVWSSFGTLFTGFSNAWGGNDYVCGLEFLC